MDTSNSSDKYKVEITANMLLGKEQIPPQLIKPAVWRETIRSLITDYTLYLQYLGRYQIFGNLIEHPIKKVNRLRENRSPETRYANFITPNTRCWELLELETGQLVATELDGNRILMERLYLASDGKIILGSFIHDVVVNEGVSWEFPRIYTFDQVSDANLEEIFCNCPGLAPEFLYNLSTLLQDCVVQSKYHTSHLFTFHTRIDQVLALSSVKKPRE